MLYHLAHDGPSKQRDLVRVLRVEPATMTGVVAALVRKGSSSRSPTPPRPRPTRAQGQPERHPPAISQDQTPTSRRQPHQRVPPSQLTIGKIPAHNR
ncbi:hypothetical protein ACH4U7_51165 [Streptomyces sp. NPDC020845]|uniref:hypothetical protein n=1 Tax=Streptomyces sp. NPDC020845 TaxID=3365096 RepID=UPI0037BC1231